MEIEGKIKMIGTTQEVGSSGFKKRDVVVTTDEQYPQDILIQFVQDKCEILDKYSVGQDVKISINIRGRMWTDPQGKEVYFNTLQGWRIEKLSDAPAPVEDYSPPFPTTAAPADEVDNDLPF